MKQQKQKKCRCGCGEMFVPRSPLQIAAHPDCAVRLAVKKREKVAAEKVKTERKADLAQREKMKSRRDWMREAQAAANAYVRLRDDAMPCISCGRHHQGQYHGGHYLSRGANPGLALDERNIHKQCQPCNTHLSGNQINYRNGLIRRYGVALVEWLEGPHEPKKFTIEDLKRIRDEYRGKGRELRKKMSDAT